jgi:hypothetical protein
MEVNTNLSTIGLNGSVPANNSTPPAVRQNSDRPDTLTLSTLDQAIQNQPASRSDAVERARGLVSDPNYPPLEVMNQVGQLIANHLTNQQ